MGSGQSSEVKINTIQELEGFDDSELSKKDKAFKNSILQIYNEIKEIKDKKSDKIFYKLPKTSLMSLFIRFTKRKLNLSSVALS